MPGFRFNLGFSGKFYHKGTAEENTGDDLLIGEYFYLYISSYFEELGVYYFKAVSPGI